MNEDILEIREGMADHETRLLALENAHSPSDAARNTRSYTPPAPEPDSLSLPEWSQRQWDRFQQLEARVIYLEKKLLEVLSKKKMKGRW